MLPPQLDILAHKRLLHSLVLGHVGEYFHTICALTPFSPTPTSFDTTSTLTTLHLESDGFFLLFFEYYELDYDLKLSSNSFKLAFQ
jgi:hypothetical protein